MDATLGSGRSDPHHDVAVASLAADEPRGGVEDALAKLAHRAARDIPDPQTRTEGDGVVAVPQAAEASVRVTAAGVSAVTGVVAPSAPTTAADVASGSQAGAPSVLATVRPAEFRTAPFPSEKPSPGRRATRAVTRFLIAVCVGVAGSLAWQSYGGAAREMIATRIPQLAWIAAPPAMNQTVSPAAATGQGSAMPALEASASPTAVAQAAPDTPPAAAAQGTPVAQSAPQQTAANAAVPTAPAAPSSDQQQLETMSRDLGALRQSVEQLTARQEQMTRDMAKLQAAEISRHRTSVPPPHPATAARRPPMPPQAPPQVSSAVPRTLPPPPLAPQVSVERPPPAAAPQPAMAPQPIRPPMPVLGQP